MCVFSVSDNVCVCDSVSDNVCVCVSKSIYVRVFMLFTYMGVLSTPHLHRGP
jgi:hypothetical protein